MTAEAASAGFSDHNGPGYGDSHFHKPQHRSGKPSAQAMSLKVTWTDRITTVIEVRMQYCSRWCIGAWTLCVAVVYGMCYVCWTDLNLYFTIRKQTRSSFESFEIAVHRIYYMIQDFSFEEIFWYSIRKKKYALSITVMAVQYNQRIMFGT